MTKKRFIPTADSSELIPLCEHCLHPQASHWQVSKTCTTKQCGCGCICISFSKFKPGTIDDITFDTTEVT